MFDESGKGSCLLFTEMISSSDILVRWHSLVILVAQPFLHRTGEQTSAGKPVYQ